MAESALALRVAWQRHVAADLEPLDGLLARHRERHRRYHTAKHVEWVIRHVEDLAIELGGAPAPGTAVDDLGGIVAAAFYHDAVYEPRSPSSANERGSARLARRDLAALGWEPERADRVGTMIEGTATHLDPTDVDTAVLFDADLAVLAAEPAGYGDYVRNVRAEYRHVADPDWAAGRAAVLRGFLDRAAIYATAPGRDRWEQRARANLTAELATLT